MSNATRTTTLHRRLKNNIMNNPSCPLQLPDMNVAEIADERGGVVLVDLLLQHCYIYFLPIGPIYIYASVHQMRYACYSLKVGVH
jgi:hypothetical protein